MAILQPVPATRALSGRWRARGNRWRDQRPSFGQVVDDRVKNGGILCVIRTVRARLQLKLKSICEIDRLLCPGFSH